MKTDSPPTHTIMRVLILACMVAASYGAAINCFVGVKGDATTPWASKACADKEVCQTTTVTTTAKAAAKTETAVTTGACAAEDTANDKAKNTCAAAVAGATWVLDTTDGVSTVTCRCNTKDCNNPPAEDKAKTSPAAALSVTAAFLAAIFA